MNISNLLNNIVIELKVRYHRIRSKLFKTPPKTVPYISGKIEITPDIIQRFLSQHGKDDRIGELERRIDRLNSEIKKQRELSEQTVEVNITDEIRNQKHARIKDVVSNGIPLYRIPKECELWSSDEIHRGKLVDIIEYKGKVYCFYLVTKKLTLPDGKRVEKRFVRVIGDKPASMVFKNYENLANQIKNKKVSINFDSLDRFIPPHMVMV